jgi:hypothetical protein
MNNIKELNEIKELNAQIEILNNGLNHIRNAEKCMQSIFPNHSIGESDKVMINEKINLIKEEIKEISLKITKGEILNIEEVSKVVIESWGKNKVHIEEANVKDDEELFEEAVGLFEYTSGVQFNKSEIKIVNYTVKTNSRNDLWLVRVYLAPGLSYATLDTGKVGWHIDVMDNKKFLELLRLEIQDNS